MNNFIQNIPKFGAYFATAFYLTARADAGETFDDNSHNLYIASCVFMWLAVFTGLYGQRLPRKPIGEFVLAYMALALFLTGVCVDLDKDDNPEYGLSIVSCILIWIGFAALFPQVWIALRRGVKVSGM